MKTETGNKKKGDTTVILLTSSTAPTKVSAPKDDGVNGHARFFPERATPANLERSLRSVFAPVAA